MKNFTNSALKSVFSIASFLIFTQALSGQVISSGASPNATTALQSTSDEGNDFGTNATCGNFAIASIQTTNLSGCFTADGVINLACVSTPISYR